MKKRLILIVFLALLLGVGSLVYWGQRKEHSRELYYSGTIEATQANLAFQVSGRVKDVFFDEGQAVEKKQLLAVLEPEEFIAQRDQVQADLMRAGENLKQLETLLEIDRKVLPAEVDKAEAGARALESQLAELEAGYRTQEVEQARLAFEEARFTLEEAHKDKIRFDKLFEKKIIAEKDKDTKDLKYETALKEFERAKKAYELLKEGYRKESIETARSKLTEGRAAARQARDSLKKNRGHRKRGEGSQSSGSFSQGSVRSGQDSSEAHRTEGSVQGNPRQPQRGTRRSCDSRTGSPFPVRFIQSGFEDLCGGDRNWENPTRPKS